MLSLLLHRTVNASAQTFGKRKFSSTSFALRSVNTNCLLGCYYHALWDSVAQVLPAVPEDLRPALTQAIQDGCNAAQSVIRCELDTMDCLVRAIGTSVTLR